MRSYHFIVPPQLLEQRALRGSAEERELALATLSIDHSIRAGRIQNALLAGSAQRLQLAVRRGAGRPDRTVFDAKHRLDTHATSVLRTEEGQPSADAAANQAFDGLGATYGFYWDVFRRDSIDNATLPLLGEVHFGERYDNAFWDGQRMMFGDGDGQLFTGFTKAIDVIGHELTHGVTEATLGLRYLGQPGALNESISDVFGSMVKQYQLGQTSEQADWLIGAGILGSVMQGEALRSMKAPGTAYEGDNQPGSMSGYVSTASDNGGVHLNSGIPNHAFYLAAVALGGHAWEKAGRIWYEVMVRRAVGSQAGFVQFAQATTTMAASLFGLGSAEARAVQDAWRETQVL